MDEMPGWAAGVDVDRPSAARMYDYALGGSHNFAADREATQAVIAAF
ncbi:SAM-dependent methyltransferase, partial [Frankia sp. CpI1-P]